MIQILKEYWFIILFILCIICIASSILLGAKNNSCSAKQDQIKPDKIINVIETDGGFKQEVFVFKDVENNNVCYITKYNNNISCVAIKGKE